MGTVPLVPKIACLEIRVALNRCWQCAGLPDALHRDELTVDNLVILSAAPEWRNGWSVPT
jgi:hypothetical protein